MLSSYFQLVGKILSSTPTMKRTSKNGFCLGEPKFSSGDRATLRRNSSAFSAFLLTLLLFVSCRPDKINSEKEYYQWLNDPKNQLCVTKTIKGLNLSVKYLPPEYLTYNELKEHPAEQSTIDSLRGLYQKNRTFLLTFSPKENKAQEPQSDIMYDDITSNEEYMKRFQDLTFDIGQYIQLKTELNTYVPVLHTFENTFGLSPYKSIYLVFGEKGIKNDDLLSSGKLQLVFNDLIFSTGISYFNFKKNQTDHIPHINFWKR
jgi:hypothetical protein